MRNRMGDKRKSLWLGPRGRQDIAGSREEGERQLHQKHLLSTYCIPGTERTAVSKTKAATNLLSGRETGINNHRGLQSCITNRALQGRNRGTSGPGGQRGLPGGTREGAGETKGGEERQTVGKTESEEEFDR